VNEHAEFVLLEPLDAFGSGDLLPGLRSLASELGYERQARKTERCNPAGAKQRMGIHGCSIHNNAQRILSVNAILDSDEW
jgi:hypothetical protein